MSFTSSQFKQFAVAAAQSADAKQGISIHLLDLKKAQNGLSDYLLILSANSSVHMTTLRDAIEESLENLGVAPLHREGARDSHWMALDYGGLLVHIFLHEKREFFSLERLWHEAKDVPWDLAAAARKAKTLPRRKKS